MGTFITDASASAATIFPDGDKAAAPNLALRSGWTSDNVLRATEANALRDGLVDARTEIRGQCFNVKHYAGGAACGQGLTDDTATIQAALNAAAATSSTTGMKEVYIPDGLWLITSALTIGSNTHLKASPRATIKRNADFNNMLRNNADGVTGGYTANSNIIVEGGIWDGNSSGYATNCTTIAFGHCTDITVKDAIFKNQYLWHHVELNAVTRGQVLNCRFEDLTGSAATESVQLDLMKDSSVFPWFGPYDNTPCLNILVDGCTFTGTQPRAFGSHSSVASVRHTRIRFTNNFVENCQGEAIQLLNYQDVVISGNVFENCYRGVYGLSDGSTTCDGFVVTNNVFKNFLTYTSTQARAVYFAGTVGLRAFRKGVISNNLVQGIGRHGIGADYGDHWTISNNIVHTIGGAGVGTGFGIALWFCQYSAASGNVVEDAYANGIIVNGATQCAVVGNTVRRAVSSSGILVQGSSTHCTVVGNVIAEGTTTGINVNASTYNLIASNDVYLNGTHGIIIDGSSHNNVVNNVCRDNGQTTTNTYDGINIDANSDSNNVQGNLVRTVAAGTRQRYGIRVNNANCDTNVVTNNDVLGGGQTATYSDAGTGTVTVAGNRL